MDSITTLSSNNGIPPLSLPSSITSLPFIKTPLTTTQISSLQPVKLFTLSSSNSTEPCIPYTSIQHNQNGNFFITTSPDGSLQLFDSLRARQYKTIYSKKYGCSNAIFTLRTATHSIPSTCIIASTIPVNNNDLLDNSLRFLDLNTNSFIRYFQGHQNQVTSIISSSSSIFGLDAFYSSSMDGTIRAWDSRNDKCYACLSNMGNNPIISLDISGTVLAIWNQNDLSVTLVPLESFPIGKIGQIKIDSYLLNNNNPIEKLVWADKNLLILDSPGNNKIVIDTLKLSVIGLLIGVTNFVISSNSDDVTRNGSLDVTPDGGWCLAGSGDGSILSWNLSSLTNSTNSINLNKLSPIKIRNNDLIDKNIIPRILSVNPKLGCVVTADTEIVINEFEINKK